MTRKTLAFLFQNVLDLGEGGREVGLFEGGRQPYQTFG